MFHKNYTLLYLLNALMLVSPLQASLQVKQNQPRDAFAWQNEKHFLETMQKFSLLAETEFPALLDRIIESIDQSAQFFKAERTGLLTNLQDKIYNWMHRDVLCEKSDSKTQEVSGGQEEHDSSDSQNRTHDYGDTSVSVTDGASHGSCEDSNGSEEINSSNEEDKRAIFEEWQLSQLFDVLGIYCSSINEFTQKSIDIDVIESFLENQVKDGYSWLINEEIEHISRAFSDIMEEQIEMPRDLLCEILEGLWFEYNWHQFSIRDELFIAQTFKNALLNLKEGCYDSSIKEHIVRSLTELFTFNPNDFAGSFSQMRENYNTYVQQNNWLGALIEWSVYCTYRKVFAEYEETTLKNSDSLLLPRIHAFNAKKRVLTSIKNSGERAQEYYTKAYIQETTTKLVFEDTKGKKKEFEFSEKLKELRIRGQSYEPYRPRKKENVFVPQVHFIVQKLDDTSAPEFIEIPMLAVDLNLPERPLTKAKEDKVFKKEDNISYFNQVKKDYTAGRIIQGKTKKDAEAHIQKKIDNKGGQNQELVHSERVLIELLRNREYVKHMVTMLAQELIAGSYIVHGLVMLGYSTNAICPQCTPTLITLMNSHEEGGFMRMLTDELADYTGKVNFFVPFSDITKDVDWTAFRMNIFVTAKINFDCQAHDLTEKGQQMRKKGTKPSKTAVPHGPLYMPNNECILSNIPQQADGTLDPQQRFFYEFVGKDMHKDGKQDVTNKNVLFSSGSKSWSKPKGT